MLLDPTRSSKPPDLHWLHKAPPHIRRSDMPRQAIVTQFEPFETSRGIVQVGELVEAKVAVTDSLCKSRRDARRNCIYLGLNYNGRVCIEHLGTHDQTVLMNNRIYKKR